MIITGAVAQQPRMAPPADNSAITTSPATPKAVGNFIAAQGADMWVFSKFKGTDVLGPDDKHIGDVTDLVFDKNGKIDGVVVGVGGFLGIGEKNVAIDLAAFQVVPANTGSSTTTSTSDDPSNIKLKVAWTKDELKNAPDFQYYKAASRTSGNPPATTGAAPRPSTLPPANAPAPR
jgi:sporulation protein YlmC with PRC-barrel domain